MKIGCRAHDFGRRPPEELARAIAAHQLTCVQLAPSKAFPDIDWRMGELTPAVATRAATAFSACGVEISVLGCYVNPIHPDPDTRRLLLDIFKEHLRVARDFGCGVVALETGSLNADYTPHPENHTEAAFQKMVLSISALVEAAEQADVCVGVEAVTTHTVWSPSQMRKLLDCIASDHIGVVFDPVNYLDAGNWRSQEHIFKEAFDLYGDRIVAVHAKDFCMDSQALKPVALGQDGLLDLESAFPRLLRQRPDLPVLLEEISVQSAEISLRRAWALWKKE